MKCPYCSSTESKVTDKRESENEEHTRRRRECLKCQKRFTTYERVELSNLIVVKKDGNRQQWSRDKVLNGIIKACEKRPIPLEDVEKLVDEIEADFRNEGLTEITTAQIGEKIMNKLKEIDEIAYIRFASVYREFADITSFEKELKQLLNNKRVKKRGSKSV
ncbi:transcriptional repressor NrdR [Candidatus Woesearchaeota archaeon]|nr:transcriptional repressor NrdR [Candidatus Woesearchaeota archaeon]